MIIKSKHNLIDKWKIFYKLGNTLKQIKQICPIALSDDETEPGKAFQNMMNDSRTWLGGSVSPEDCAKYQALILGHERAQTIMKMTNNPIREYQHIKIPDDIEKANKFWLDRSVSWLEFLKLHQERIDHSINYLNAFNLIEGMSKFVPSSDKNEN